MTFNWVPRPGDEVEIACNILYWAGATANKGEIWIVSHVQNEILIYCMLGDRVICAWHPEVSTPRFGFVEIRHLPAKNEWEGDLELL